MHKDDIDIHEHVPFNAIKPKSNAVSKYRIILSQCFATFVVDLLKVAHGYYLGFSMVLLSILYKEKSEISMTLSELTWFGSSCFMVPIGSILGGIIAHRIGTRLLLIWSTFLFATSVLLFYFARTSSMILVAQAIAGLTGGMFKGPTFAYTAEISQSHLRSILMATCTFSLLLGMLMGMIISGHMYWRNVVLINFLFISSGIILTYFIPESPHWLTYKRRYHEAKLALAWFRGWTNTKSIEVEYLSMLENVKSLSTFPTESVCKKSSGELKSQSYFKKVSSPLTQKEFYLPLMTMILIFIINDFGGTYTVKMFSMLVFKKLDAPIHEHTASSILLAIPIVGAISVILTIHLIGKRKLVFFSVAGMGCFFAIAGAYGFLKAQNFYITQYSASNWIPTIAVLLAALASSAGIDKIVFLLCSELYPLRFRQVGIGINHALNSLSMALLNKLFLYMVNEMTLSGVFLFFSFVNIVGFIIIYFILPETEGKTLREIENHYAHVTCLKGMATENKDRISEMDVCRRPLFKSVTAV